MFLNSSINCSTVPGTSSWVYLLAFFPNKVSVLPSNRVSTSTKPPERVAWILSGRLSVSCAGTRERKLLFVVGDDLERRVVVERYRFLFSQVVRHRLEQSLGLRRVGESDQLDPAVEGSPLGRVVGGDRPLLAGAGRGQPFDSSMPRSTNAALIALARS